MSIEVWNARATLGWDGHPDSPMDFWPSTVSVDEAADLASDIFGGPVIAVTPQASRVPAHWRPVAWNAPSKWTLSVRAFTEVEAYELLCDTIPPLIADRLHEIRCPQVWRLRFGELVPERMSA